MLRVDNIDTFTMKIFFHSKCLCFISRDICDPCFLNDRTIEVKAVKYL